MSSNALTVSNLSKTYRMYAASHHRLCQSLLPSRQWYKEKQALKSLSFSLEKGKTLGIVGCNGSGKSTLLQLIAGILEPTSGLVEVKGKIAALLELGAGFNPAFSGKDNVFLNASLLGLSKEEIDACYDEIVAFSGLGDAIHQPVKTYSSGMVVRLGFAISAQTNPDIMIIDEALSVGDERFQRKCFLRLDELKSRGATIIFVSHNGQAIINFCDEALLLDDGDMLLQGDPKTVIHFYQELLYSDGVHRDQIKMNIRQLAKQGKRSVYDDDEDGQKFEAYLPQLKPEHSISFASKGAYIGAAILSNMQGKQVNVLVSRGRYTLSYPITFDQDCQDIRTNFRIQTTSGLLAFAFNTESKEHQLTKASKGDMLMVTFSFCANLLPGYYYITLSCSGVIDGEQVPLHRITDALMMRVVRGEALRAAGGIADCMGEVAITLERQDGVAC